MMLRGDPTIVHRGGHRHGLTVLEAPAAKPRPSIVDKWTNPTTPGDMDEILDAVEEARETGQEAVVVVFAWDLPDEDS